MHKLAVAVLRNLPKAVVIIEKHGLVNVFKYFIQRLVALVKAADNVLIGNIMPALFNAVVYALMASSAVFMPT